MIKWPSSIANENPMRIGLTGRRERDLHCAIQLLREQSNAQHAHEFSSSIRDRLLHADFDAALRFWEFSIELRPMQIAPQELTGKILPRRCDKGCMRCWIGTRSRLIHGVMAAWRNGREDSSSRRSATNPPFS